MKTIDKFLGKDKSADQDPDQSRLEAMTLEEMAVQAQERKILGTERKIDANIIMFVALCVCGLIIINVVLYFLITESKSGIHTTQPSQNARELLREQTQERANQISISEVAELVEPQGLAENESGQFIAEGANRIEGAVDPAVVSDDPPGNAKEVIQEPQPEEFIESFDEEPTIQEPEKEEIPFDVVISVGSTINDWANAWSAQDVDAYLSYYADSFVSEAGMNMEQWREHRAIRLTKPEWISIGIDKLKINPTPDGAKAEFIQEYNASNYSDKELKKMNFRKVDGGWKIFDERATPVD